MGKQKDMKIIFIIISIISFNPLYACDCGKLLDLKASQERGIARSGIIIIGDVISSNKTTNVFSNKVIEVLKGKVNSDTLKNITMITDCSVTPEVGRWLFYFDINFGYNFHICGM